MSEPATLSSRKRKADEEDGAFCIVSQNVETLLPLLQFLQNGAPLGFRSTREASTSGSDVPGPWNPVREIIRAHDPHVICLQEIKCVQRDKELVRAIPLAANKRFTGVKGQKAYKAFHSVSSTATGRVVRRNFGVATYVREDVKVVRTREVEWDKEGRVVVVELEDMAIYNVYALNSSQNPWFNPFTKTIDGDRATRKRAFNKLLMQDVVKQRERTPHVVLIGDFNISFTPLDSWPRLRSEPIHTIPRREFLEEIIPGMGVVDIFRRKYGNVEAFSWFNRGDAPGKARVDYALVTEGAVPAVIRMRYMPNEIGESDHCPVVLELDRRRLQDRRETGPPAGRAASNVDPDNELEQVESSARKRARTEAVPPETTGLDE